MSFVSAVILFFIMLTAIAPDVEKNIDPENTETTVEE